MRLTVLGSSASYAGPGQACAGYLVQTPTASVLMDCGNGVLSNLARVLDPLELDAVFITHGHPDHMVDLYALQALLRYAPEGPAAPLRLHAPRGMLERMGTLLSERGSRELAEAFAVVDLTEESTVFVGDLAVTPLQVDHSESAFALVVDHGDRRLTYTGDTAPSSRALRAATGARLLLAEATLPERYAGAGPHMTASQAGSLAREAGVARLVLTHVWPTNDRTRVEEEARAAFGTAVSVAAEFDTYDI